MSNVPVGKDCNATLGKYTEVLFLRQKLSLKEQFILLTELITSRKIFILMKGSRPFCVSMCQGLGLASRSDTLP